MVEIQAPNSFDHAINRTVFLGGSIEMGKAENWQQRIVKEFADYDVTFLNPRRDDWDWTWEQSINNPQFVEQVTWEQDALEFADVIIIYFDPNTKSPISLLELGLFAHTGVVIVCCPPGFWRKGNVDIICKRYDIPLVETYEQLVALLK